MHVNIELEEKTNEFLHFLHFKNEGQNICTFNLDLLT